MLAASARSRTKRADAAARAAFDPTKELGVQPPVQFWDPLGFCADGDEEAFRRRQGVEIKHGRIAMLASIGMIVPEYYRFPGYLSPSQDLKFADMPSGIAAISKVPAEGWLQIVIFAGLMEGRFGSSERAPGDYNQGNLGLLGLLGPVADPEERKKKLSAEIANGRLAMFAIMGLLFQNGVTGETGSAMYGAGENSAEVYKIAFAVLTVIGFLGEGFRKGPDPAFYKYYNKNIKMYGRDID